MFIRDYNPEGAIRTADQIVDLVNRARQGQEIILFEVNGTYPKVNSIKFNKNATIVTDELMRSNISFKCFPQGRDGNEYFYFNDHNIGASYNNNYMFADLESAETCSNHMLTDPHHITCREEWITFCNELDRACGYDYYDDYDD